MRVLLAPDKFKGSLTAAQVARHLATGLTRSVPDLDVVSAPVADGGDGTLDALASQGFVIRTATVTGSDGRPRLARFGVRGQEGAVELSEADGLRHIDEANRRPLLATSRGVGELLLATLDSGCRTVILALGGSANTDGGAGMMQALGLQLRDFQGRELGPGGANLRDLGVIDTSNLDARLARTTFLVATDVDNPLLGGNGAAAVYAPQKGASASDVEILEAGLHRWAEKVTSAVGSDFAQVPGAGAAGGVGFAALAFLAATARPGIDLILELFRFNDLLDGVSLVITGEGSLDEQSLSGKAPVGVAAAAAQRGIPTIAVAGRSTLRTEQAAAAGIGEVYTLIDREPDLQVCLREAGRILEGIGYDIARTL